MTARPRLLLLSPSFFGYEEEIAAAFERRGFDVHFIDERPSNGSLQRALFRVARHVLRRSIDRYYRRVAEAVGTAGFDLVLVVKGEVVPRWFLERVRRDAPYAVFAFYTFDSVANSSGMLSVVDLFDRAYSFEPGAVAAGRSLEYKPLFYSPQFALPASGAPTDRTHQVTFVGTLHSDRYRFVQRIRARFPRTFVYLYAPARWYFALQWVRDVRLRSVRLTDVHFRKAPRELVAKVFRDSHAVLDMQHERQTGLTMRTFEVLASGAFLVTTNPLAEAQLGATGRVLMVGAVPTDADLERLDALLQRPAPTAAPVGFERHSIDAWVEEFAALIPERGGA